MARKVPIEDLAQGKDKKKLKHAYFTRTMEEPVFLHELCILKTEQPPEWVVYQEVYEVNGKMYMRGVTAIDPTWLTDFCPLDCNLSKPLVDREPIYDQEKGQVLTYRTGTFGERCWPLPLIKTVHPSLLERTKYFAKFLLEGLVFPHLKGYSNELLSPPIAMIRSWGNLHSKRTKPLYETLLENGVDAKDKLVKKLEENPKFLMKDYLKWLDDDHHNEVTKIWLGLLQ